MFVDVVQVLVKLLASFFLAISGFLMYSDWKEKKRHTLFYWSIGLIIWAIVCLLDIFAFAELSPENSLFILIRNIIMAVSFILFFLHGTLILLLPEKQAKPLILVYFGLVVYLEIFFTQNVPNIYMKQAMNNVYMINPLSIVFFFYFMNYYVKLKDKKILKIAINWGVIFILNLLFIALVSSKVIPLVDLTIILIYSSILFIAFSFYNVKNTSEEVWDAITTPKHYVVDKNIEYFLSNYLGDKAHNAIVDGLKDVGATRFSDMKDFQKGQFIDHILDKNFADLSAQRGALIKTKLIHLLGMSSPGTYWRAADTEF
ncbi:MAG: hypothetical protein ACLFPQ_03500 [Candidatus Woesearchaeota archaeon]